MLSAERIDGMTLNEWLRTGPGREERDRLARKRFQDLFISGLYRLHRIHADPNPGNFIVKDDGKIGLVDFGCVKSFWTEFVSLYGELPRKALQGDRSDYRRLLEALRIAGPATTPQVHNHLFKVFHEIGQWLGKLYREEYFDFRANPGFIAAGKKMMAQSFELRKHVDLNTNFSSFFTGPVTGCCVCLSRWRPESAFETLMSIPKSKLTTLKEENIKT